MANANITLKETLKQLEALHNEKVRTHNKKNGARDSQFGVRLGDIRKLAAKIKTNRCPIEKITDANRPRETNASPSGEFHLYRMRRPRAVRV